MISLLLNSRALPAFFPLKSYNRLDIKVDGRDPLSAVWSVLEGDVEVSSGSTLSIPFNPLSTVTHYLNVKAINLDGKSFEQTFQVSVTERRSGSPHVSVAWKSLNYSDRSTIEATISYVDPEGAKYGSLEWTLYRNNVLVSTGKGTSVTHLNSSYGIYRLRATATDIYGTSVVGESTVKVVGEFEVQASLKPPLVNGTLQFLGSVYTYQVFGDASSVTSLPYELASHTQEIVFLPGTTHFKVEVDPGVSHGIDDILVRTMTGNWALVGGPNGFSTEKIGYDYTLGNPHTPAPSDLRTKLTFEAYKVHGTSVPAFTFRVKISCYREGSKLYRYTPCPYSTFVGGRGRRDRRFVAYPTHIDASLDTLSQTNRMGSSSVECLSAPEVTELPSVFSSSGIPNPLVVPNSVSYTDANVIAVYESSNDAVKEIDAYAVFGLDGYGQGLLSLTVPSDPPIFQRIKRIYGNLAVYMASGGISVGSTIVVTIGVSHAPGSVQYTVPVTNSVYSQSPNNYIHVGSIPIDLVDFQFSQGGLILSYEVEEPTDEEVQGSPGAPELAGSAPEVYSTALGTGAVTYESACYSAPTLQTEFSGTSFSSVGILSGCFDPACGPVGLYCYANVQNPILLLHYPQPYLSPSPYVAYGTDIANCYGDPVLISDGTLSSLGTFPYVIPYPDTGLCGAAYRYKECTRSRTDIVVSYPIDITAPDFVAFDGLAWSNYGTISNLGGNTLVSRSLTLPIQSCSDPIVTGSNSSGSTVPYLDFETRGTVNVCFPGLENGIPHFSTSIEVTDNASLIQPGYHAFDLTREKNEVLILPPVVSSGTLQFSITGAVTAYPKSLITSSSGNVSVRALAPGKSTVVLCLAAGDSVYIRVDRVSKGHTIDGRASWDLFVSSPRLYHTEVLSFSGSAALNAVGFTGRSSRSPYKVFSSLPQFASSDYVNPNSVVTVQGYAGTEAFIVGCASTGANQPDLPVGVGLYAGAHLDSPITFKFYAGRSAQGGHGEMDVWLSQNGTFPSYMRVSRYKALELPTWWYRKDAAASDTSRNSLRHLPVPDNYIFPRVYTAEDGNQVVLRSGTHSNTISINGTSYGATGTATGLAYTIIDTVGDELPSSGDTVVTADVFIFSEDEELIYTEDGQSLETEI